MASSEELGTLICVILKAQNLNDKHTFYKQDVFAQVSLNGVTQKTKVDIKGGQHPIWDEEVRYSILKDASGKNRKLEVSVFSKEPRTEDLLGQATVDIEETLKTGEFDEWVRLELNGVARGEIYLEMTFYSNAPQPAKLAVPKNTALERRPSKLNPTERLWRPPQGRTPPKSNSPSIQVRGSPYLTPSPPSSRSSSSSSRAADVPLPPLPSDLIPGNLRPGARSHPQVQAPPAVPSILKPGHGQRPPPNHARQTSGSSINESVASSQGLGYIPATGPVQYSYTSQPEYTGPVSYPPPAAQDPWAAETIPVESLSFPVPQLPHPTQGSHDYKADHSYGVVPTQHGPYQDEGRSDLPDPYLLARYQSPLPLPPGSSPSSREQSAPLPLKKDPKEEARLQAQILAEKEAKRRQEQEERELARQVNRTQPIPPKKDPKEEARLQAQLLAEKEAKRRREQEEKDLELARQLDLELNINGSAPTTPGDRRHMPGGW